MRAWLILVLLAASLAGAADDPAPLLKPVTPGGTRVRVRVATSEEGSGFYHFAARVPKAKGKKDEAFEVTVAFECRPGKSCVAAKKWKSWGFEVPAKGIGVLPELVIPASQPAPKTSRRKDVDVKLTNLKLEIVDPPGEADKILGCDLLLAVSEVTRNADRIYEPRFYFADKFLELTVPGSAVKTVGSEGAPPPDPAINPDPKLVPVMGPMATRGLIIFDYAAVNGHDRHQGRDGKPAPVPVTIASTTNCPGGIIMSIGIARACGVELAGGKDLAGTGTDFKTTIAKGKVKEFRLGFRTGSDMKTQKDLVLKDVTVWIDRNDSGHMIWLGPNFLREHFEDPVYSCGPDGAWKLHGRVKPELLQDIKTRPKK